MGHAKASSEGHWFCRSYNTKADWIDWKSGCFNWCFLEEPGNCRTQTFCCQAAQPAWCTRWCGIPNSFAVWRVPRLPAGNEVRLYIASQTTPTFSVSHTIRFLSSEPLKCSLPSAVHHSLLSWNLQDRCSTGELMLELTVNNEGVWRSDRWRLAPSLALPLCVDIPQMSLTFALPGNMLCPLLSECTCGGTSGTRAGGTEFDRLCLCVCNSRVGSMSARQCR